MSTAASLRVVTQGVATSVRDAGVLGRAHLGRSRGGAVDAAALALANRLVGNDERAAGVETSGGFGWTSEHPVLVAVAGSPADLAVDRGPPLGWGVATALPAGARVHVGRLRGGARTYVAVRGGLRGVGLGACAGDELVIGPEPTAPPSGEFAVPPAAPDAIEVWPGPRRDWFAASAWTVLTSVEWVVQPASDRVGARLDGARLERVRLDELPSEGLVEGAVQVPPDGRPIVMLADHPTTGGYPVIAVVDPRQLAHVAQAPPGATLRFRTARGAARTAAAPPAGSG